MLERLRPELPLLQLRTLPGSSLSHGDMITLLLRENRAPFGILDHDLYVFDQSIYDRLAFQPDEIALTLFWDKGRLSGRPYAHTFFLYFQTQLLNDLMDRFQIDARIVRRAPEALEKRLYEIGLFEGRFPKDYLDYFDTLQLLFAAAETEGYSWRPVERVSSQDAVHVGGTSFSAYGAKDMAQLYIHLSFLEISCAQIQRHYAPLVAPYQSAAELLEQLSDAKQRSIVKAVDALIERLQSRLACEGVAAKRSASLER